MNPGVRIRINRPNRPGVSLTGFLGLLLQVTGALQMAEAVATSPAADDPQPTRYGIIVTGSELLAGKYADGHTHFITRTLAPLGLQCLSSTCVPDNPADIRQALGNAAKHAELIIVTGGLGPTDNDLTREVLADFTGIALKEHLQALQDMARRFGTTPANLQANLRRQVQVPTQGTYFGNSNGTALGLAFEKQDLVVIALPGPPRELQPMVQDALLPYLSQRYGTRLPGRTLTLRFVGLGQSRIDQVLSEHVQMPANVTLSSQFQGGRVDFSFTLPTDTAQDRALLETLKREIMQHLGDSIYADSDTSLEEHVVQSLRARGITLSLAEIGSGGHLSAALMRTPGVAAVLAGSFVAPTPEGLRALLKGEDDAWKELTSAQRTAYLARTAAQAADSLWGLAVGAPQTNKTGSQSVDVYTWIQGRPEHRSLRFYGPGEAAQARLTTVLLDQLRRQLKQFPPLNAPNPDGTE